MYKERPKVQRKSTYDPKLQHLLQYLGSLLPSSEHRKKFFEFSIRPQPPSFRLNNLLYKSKELKSTLPGKFVPVPWCEDGFVSPKSIQIGRSFEHAIGGIYIQAKAPMLAVETLDPKPGDRVLDLCAAPGGKSTQIAARMNNTGLLVANESSSKRISSLVGNVERCSIANSVITQAKGTILARYFHNYFDRILVDAPCSGDGILRKDKNFLRYWSVENSKRQAQIQIGLLRAAFHMLRPGGTLVYSTCSLSIEENEHVLMGLIGRYGRNVIMENPPDIEAPILPDYIKKNLSVDVSKGVRVWPHVHNTEGAFIARMSKSTITEWPKIESDAKKWAETQIDETAASKGVEILEKLWNRDLPRIPGQVVAYSGKQILTQPKESESLRKNLPFFVRSGMRIGHRYKQFYHLSQPAVSLWGEKLDNKHINLVWPQVQQLFQGLAFKLNKTTKHRGEIICRFRGWSICKAMIECDGTRLNPMLPKVHRNETVCSLFDWE